MAKLILTIFLSLFLTGCLEYKGKDLYHAIEDGDVTKVRSLLKWGSVNRKINPDFVLIGAVMPPVFTNFKEGTRKGSN